MGGLARCRCPRLDLGPGGIAVKRERSGCARNATAGSTYEAQAWGDAGELLASHWWPTVPGPAALEHFGRAAGLRGSDTPSEQVSLEPLARVWARNQRRNAAGMSGGLRLLAPVLLAFVGLLIADQGVQFWHWNQISQSLQVQVEELESQVEPLLEARNRADSDLQRINELLAVQASPGQLALMDQVARLLPKSQQPRLVDWRFSPGELQVSFSVRQPDPARYVTTFQKHPLFADVSAEADRRPGVLTLRMKLARQEGGS